VSNYRQRQHLILCFHSLLNSHYYHQILLFSIFFPLLLLFSTFFIHPTFFLKVSTLFHQLHFLCNLPIHRKKIIVLPYSPIHNISLMFSLVFFTHHLKHHLHFLVFFTLFSRFWNSFLWQCLTKTSAIYKIYKIYSVTQLSNNQLLLKHILHIIFHSYMFRLVSMEPFSA